jgi:hypothetical protein
MLRLRGAALLNCEGFELGVCEGNVVNLYRRTFLE